MTVNVHHSKEELFKSAESGNGNAMYSIGYRYYKGIGGLPKNSDLAKEWFKKASDAGSLRAADMIKKLNHENQSISVTSTPSHEAYQKTPVYTEFLWVIIGLVVLYKLFPKFIKVVSLGAFWCGIIFLFFGEYDEAMMFILLILGGFLAIFIIVMLFSKREEARKIKDIDEEIRNINKVIDSEINSHVKTLSLKRKQTLINDSYGNILDNKWRAAIDYFIDNVLSKEQRIKTILEIEKRLNNKNELLKVLKNSNKSLYNYETWKKFPNRWDIQQKVILAVAEYDETEKQNNFDIGLNNIDIEKLSPIGFEHFCADILKANGWQARVTQASGDQGIDILARYNEIEVVFQCKKYSSPIGNKAVQEAIAGKQYARANLAAVVSNAAYTTSAKQLANTTGVHLLHYSELRNFKENIVANQLCVT